MPDKAIFIRQASQFFEIDLTPHLAGSGNLPKKHLSLVNGPVPELQGIYQPIGVTSDSQSVISFNPSGTVSSYSVGSNTWSPEVSMPAGTYEYEYRYSIPMTDPRTGVIYIQVKANNVTQMLAYNPATNTRTFIPMPLTYQPSDYYMVWSQYFDGLVYFNANAMERQVKFQIYRPSSVTWNYLTFDGIAPDPRTSPSRNGCMVSAYGGQKLIIVGGQSSFDTIPGVLIIDAATLTWTAGPAVANGRGGMACATAGDYIVLYGGAENFQTSSAPVGPIFYNMKTNSWGNPVPIASNNNTSTRQGPNPTGTEGGGTDAGPTSLPPPNPTSTSNKPAIIGGAVGGVAVISII
ncbi:hypothetical protein FBU30_004381 [Linnemannia zychae]|nr:hypothetical protein FBU30_004381 [Linnemannia zychae]